MNKGRILLKAVDEPAGQIQTHHENNAPAVKVKSKWRSNKTK